MPIRGKLLTALLEVSRDIPYLGVEPQAACVANIQTFIMSNQLKQHRVICACLSDAEGIAELEIGYEGDVRASIIPEFRPKNTFQFKIPTVTIVGDALISSMGIEAIQLIKIDVEGAEMEVLKSFRRTLETLRPPVTFEVLPDLLVSTGAALDSQTIAIRRQRETEIQSFFESIDYATYLLTPAGEEARPISPDTNNGVLNYIARPGL